MVASYVARRVRRPLKRLQERGRAGHRGWDGTTRGVSRTRADFWAKPRYRPSAQKNDNENENENEKREREQFGPAPPCSFALSALVVVVVVVVVVFRVPC